MKRLIPLGLPIGTRHFMFLFAMLPWIEILKKSMPTIVEPSKCTWIFEDNWISYLLKIPQNIRVEKMVTPGSISVPSQKIKNKKLKRTYNFERYANDFPVDYDALLNVFNHSYATYRHTFYALLIFHLLMFGY